MATPRPVEYVTLTGRPKVKSGPEELSFLPDKRYQLLSYLAYNGDWLGRERVAFLFWPDTDTANSRQNLRGLLQRLRGLPFEVALESTPQSLRWSPDTDVDRFRKAIGAALPDAAIDAYQGPLLEGLEEGDAGEFGDWLEIERGRLHEQWRGVALQRLSECQPGEHHFATDLVRRLLDQDELDEDAVRSYLTTMHRLGQPDRAHSVYRTFRARLAEEMGLEPTSATIGAAEALQSAPVRPAESINSGPIMVLERDSPRLPVLTTSFVGREDELSQLRNRLLEPDSRLLTIVGAGGVGKTRLALAAAHEVRAEYADGVAFVPLDTLATADEAPRAVAKVLGIPLMGDDETAQLVAALTGKNLLLLLDNCEHLPKLSQFVAALSKAGAGLKILATSRERLKLAAEELFPLLGLTYPTAEDSLEKALASDAVALFLDRARRVRPTFVVAAHDGPSLVKLGTYTEGLPLAIELAAAWARVLPLKDIVESIGDSLDLLASTTVDGIPRHASIRATFEQSWAALQSIEQDVLRRLAVFTGSVTGAAARYVCGSSPVVLAALVDKSLVRLGIDGRYYRHPLLKAFSREKLEQVPEEWDATVKRHASYYLRYLRERTDRARGTQPAEALEEIDTEQGEILAAAEKARARGKSAQLIALMRLLAIDTGYLPAKGFGPRRLDLMEAAAQAAERDGRWEAAHLLNGRLADAYGTHSGERPKALALYQNAAELAAKCGSSGRQIVYESMVAVMAFGLEKPGASEALDTVLARAEEIADPFSLATVLEHRAYVYGLRGEHEASKALYKRSLQVAEQLADTQFDPYEVRRLLYFGLLNLGEMELLLDQFEVALDTRKRALDVAIQSGNPIWVAHAELELGEMNVSAGNGEAARRHLQSAKGHYKSNFVTTNLERIERLLNDIDSTGMRGGQEQVVDEVKEA